MGICREKKKKKIEGCHKNNSCVKNGGFVTFLIVTAGTEKLPQTFYKMILNWASSNVKKHKLQQVLTNKLPRRRCQLVGSLLMSCHSTQPSPAHTSPSPSYSNYYISIYSSSSFLAKSHFLLQIHQPFLLKHLLQFLPITKNYDLFS